MASEDMRDVLRRMRRAEAQLAAERRKNGRLREQLAQRDASLKAWQDRAIALGHLWCRSCSRSELLSESLVREAVRGAARLVVRWNIQAWRDGGQKVHWPAELTPGVSDAMSHIGQSQAVIEAHRKAHGVQRKQDAA